jgi:hypothetical protein
MSILSVTEETSPRKRHKVSINLPKDAPIFYKAIGNSFGPKTKIAIITIDKISSQPI